MNRDELHDKAYFAWHRPGTDELVKVEFLGAKVRAVGFLEDPDPTDLVAHVRVYEYVPAEDTSRGIAYWKMKGGPFGQATANFEDIVCEWDDDFDLSPHLASVEQLTAMAAAEAGVSMAGLLLGDED